MTTPSHVTDIAASPAVDIAESKMENTSDPKGTAFNTEVGASGLTKEDQDTSLASIAPANDASNKTKGDSEGCCCSDSGNQVCASKTGAPNSCCEAGEKVEDDGNENLEEDENCADTYRCVSCSCDHIGDGSNAGFSARNQTKKLCPAVVSCSCLKAEGDCCKNGPMKTCCSRNNVSLAVSAKCSCQCAAGSPNLKCPGVKNAGKSSFGCCCPAFTEKCCQNVDVCLSKCCNSYSGCGIMPNKGSFPEASLSGKACCSKKCECSCCQNADEKPTKSCCQKSGALSQKYEDGSSNSGGCVCCQEIAAVPVCCKLCGRNFQQSPLGGEAQANRTGPCSCDSICCFSFNQCCSGSKKIVCPCKNASNMRKVGCRKDENAEKGAPCRCKCSNAADGSSSDDAGVKNVCFKKDDFVSSICYLGGCPCSNSSKNSCLKNSCCQTVVSKTCYQKSGCLCA